MAEHIINGNVVTIRNRQGSVDIMLEEWTNAVAVAAKDIQRPPQQSPEAWARNYWLNDIGREKNAGGIGKARARQRAEIEAWLQNCPERLRPVVKVCAEEFMFGESGLPPWTLAPDGLRSVDGAISGWMTLAEFGCGYLAQYRALSAVPCSDQVKRVNDAIDRRLASENSVSHQIAGRQMEIGSVREYEDEVGRVSDSAMVELLREYGVTAEWREV